ERCERLEERAAPELELDPLFGERVLASDEVAEHGLVGVADRCVETRRCTRRRAHLERLLERQRGLVRDLCERRLAPELGPESPLGPVELLHALDDVDGHADRARLVSESASDGLTDPPRRVRRELEAAAPVELLDRTDQAQRALLDQVEERETLVAVV